MSLRKKKTILIVLISVVVILNGSVIYAKPTSQLLFIACNGELRIASEQEVSKISEKYWLGDVARGMFFDGNFFAFDNNKLIATNLSLMEKTFSLGKNLLFETNYRPWKIGYVDDKRILFCTQRYDPAEPIGTQRKHYYIYQVDRKTNIVQKIAIENCGNANFSFRDNEIYYTGEDGIIYRYSNDRIQSLEIKGKSPTISPDGKKIAYISFGIIRYGIHIYEFETNKKDTIIRLGEVWPIIRWSEDSRFIAVKKRSDISSNPLFWIDTLNRRNIYKFEKSRACNWFFVEGWVEDISNP